MHRLVLFICIGLAIPAYEANPNTAGPSGSVDLDELSFDKVVNKFDAVLVKFDVAFPYGDKHDAFVQVAKDTKDVEELLVAGVSVKDYGEKDNQELAKKWGATKENFPVVKLFIKGKNEPIPFDESKGFTTEALRQFVAKNSGIYLSLPGCVRQLDQIVLKFMKATKKEDRQKLLKEAESEAKGLPEKDATSAKVYKLIMNKVLEKGDEFVKTEYQRVSKLLGGKLTEEKKNELVNRIHILHTFQQNDKEDKEKKEKKEL